MKLPLPFLCALLVTPALAQENRQLDSHEHGVGELNIAFDGTTVAMELHAPGADIVGFEYAAASAEDIAAVDAAVAALSRPLELFGLPAAAECTVNAASAELESETVDDLHDDEEPADEDHADHTVEGDKDDGDGHTEFHAEYSLNCANPEAISEIRFGYFDVFENARELEIQIVSGAGALAFEIARDAPTLDLRGLF